MTSIPQYISDTISAVAKSRAVAHVESFLLPLTTALQGSPEIQVAQPGGGAVIVNSGFLESFKLSLVESFVEKFEQDVANEFLTVCETAIKAIKGVPAEAKTVVADVEAVVERVETATGWSKPPKK